MFYLCYFHLAIFQIRPNKLVLHKQVARSLICSVSTTDVMQHAMIKIRPRPVFSDARRSDCNLF